LTYFDIRALRQGMALAFGNKANYIKSTTDPQNEAAISLGVEASANRPRAAGIRPAAIRDQRCQ